MKIKIVLLVLIIASIVTLSLFGFGLKEIALKGMVDDIPEYNCEEDLCTSCIIEGNACSCGEHTCDCGDKIVEKEQCII
jgi:hypothetical protein